MEIKNNNRKFEIPYNFDKKLIDGLKILKIKPRNIYCIYLCPFFDDYKTISRNRDSEWAEITREEYESHIRYIEDNYPGKLQLLLQQTDPSKVMNKEQLQYYIDLGFTNFCCGSIEQAKIIKELNPSLETVASIAMKITSDELLINRNYEKYFNAFVLDFSYSKNIQKIKMLPQYLKYILLCNSLCNNECDGTHHWFLPEGEINQCPGMIGTVGFYNSAVLRPMDLKYFDPYIEVYKIQDRGWPTSWILRDIVTYTTDYSVYPGITYDEDIYEAKTVKWQD